MSWRTDRHMMDILPADLFTHLFEALLAATVPNPVRSLLSLGGVSKSWHAALHEVFARRRERSAQTSDDRLMMQTLYTSLVLDPYSIADYWKDPCLRGDDPDIDRALRHLALCMGMTKDEVIGGLGLMSLSELDQEIVDVIQMEGTVKSRAMAAFPMVRVEEKEEKEDDNDEEMTELLVIVVFLRTNFQGVWQSKVLYPLENCPPRIQWLMHRYNLVYCGPESLPRSPVHPHDGYIPNTDADGGAASYKEEYAVTAAEQSGECTTDWLLEWQELKMKTVATIPE